MDGFISRELSRAFYIDFVKYSDQTFQIRLLLAVLLAVIINIYIYLFPYLKQHN